MGDPLPGLRHDRKLDENHDSDSESEDTLPGTAVKKSFKTTDHLTSNDNGGTADYVTPSKIKKQKTHKLGTIVKKMKQRWNFRSSGVVKGASSSNNDARNDVQNENSQSDSRGNTTRTRVLGGRPPVDDIERTDNANQLASVFTPCLQGIKNHGNTCFMNSVVQCLSNTDILAKLILTDIYKSLLRNHHRNHRKTPNNNCDVTEQFANIVKSLWLGEYKSELSKAFKEVIGGHAEQYQGYSQHDCQEFLLWLLDHIHQDLKTEDRTPKQPRKKITTEDDKASEALANHNGSSTSYIYEIFQGLFRSSLTCPHCGKESSTFDPYLCLELPIPQCKIRPIYLTLVYLDNANKQLYTGFEMLVDDTVAELRQRVSQEYHIPPDQIAFCEMKKDGFQCCYKDSQSLIDIPETKDHASLYAIELPYWGDLQQHELMVLAVNTSKNGKNSERFGSPMAFSLQRDCSFSEIHDFILNQMSDFIRREALGRRDFLFQLRLFDGLANKKYLKEDVEMPLYVETIDRAMILNGSPKPHLKLVVEWDDKTKNSVLTVPNYHPVYNESHISDLEKKFKNSMSASLDDCFQLFTKDEKLCDDDAWKCPSCKKLQQGTIKKFNLWSLPEILVVHLKRFKQATSTRIHNTKLNTFIEFPMNDLVLTQHALKKSGSRSQEINNEVYDLYGVCNHYGSMSGGHYTAFCKNPVTNKWVSYDDTRVQEVGAKEVVSKAAYLLFYQKRSLQPNLNNDYHWIYDMPQMNQILQRKQTDENSKESPLNEESPFPPPLKAAPPRDHSNTALMIDKNYSHHLGQEKQTTVVNPVTDPDPALVRSMTKTAQPTRYNTKGVTQLEYDSKRYQDPVKHVYVEKHPREQAISKSESSHLIDNSDGCLSVHLPPASIAHPRSSSSLSSHDEFTSGYQGQRARSPEKVSRPHNETYPHLHNATWDGDVSIVRPNAYVNRSKRADYRQIEVKPHSHSTVKYSHSTQPQSKSVYVSNQSKTRDVIPTRRYDQSDSRNANQSCSDWRDYSHINQPQPELKDLKYMNEQNAYTSSMHTNSNNRKVPSRNGSVKNKIASYESHNCSRDDISRPRQSNSLRYKNPEVQYYPAQQPVAHSRQVQHLNPQKVIAYVDGSKSLTSDFPYSNSQHNGGYFSSSSGGINHRKHYRGVQTESSV